MNPIIKEKIDQIDPNRYYTASAMARNGWTPWKSNITVTLFLNTEEGKRIYKPIITTKGSIMRYKVLGAFIIEALKSIDLGELKIDHVIPN